MFSDLTNGIMEEKKELEKKSLGANGFFSYNTKGRIKNEQEEGIRTPFMKDRDRIIHSNSFRRLKDKAQVFLLSENDMVRTRLTHTLEVSQISRTVAYALNLNESLVEAIALGHDLGHAPFGHIGERALKDLSKNWFVKDGQKLEEVDFLDTAKNWVYIPLKDFRHNVQSLRVVDFLEKKGEGLNLTYEVRDGILKHSKWGKGLLQADNRFNPQTFEGQVVRFVDRIAYVNHDLADALRNGMVKECEIPKEVIENLGDTHSARINNAVLDMVVQSTKMGKITMSEEISGVIDTLYQFLNEKVYKVIDEREGAKAAQIIIRLAEFYKENPKMIEEKIKDINYPVSVSLEQKIIDHICNMTDHFVLSEYKRVFLPKDFDRSF